MVFVEPAGLHITRTADVQNILQLHNSGPGSNQNFERKLALIFPVKLASAGTPFGWFDATVKLC